MLIPSEHLKGYIPDLPTPFDDDGELDLAAFARLCRRHVVDGGSAFAVVTATGEAPTLTRQERLALIRCAVGAAAGRVPVLAGVVANATARAIELTCDAQDAGASAILLGLPYYNKPTQAGLEAHVRAVATISRVPLILHDEPDRCARGLADDTIARLSELAEVVGICDASGDISRLPRLRALVPRDVRLLSSHDVAAPAFIALGGDGCISGAANVAPLLCRAFYNHASIGDIAKARCLTLEMAALTAALARESEPAPLKYALARQGLLSDTVRLPLVPASPPARQAVAAAITALQPWIDGEGMLCAKAG